MKQLRKINGVWFCVLGMFAMLMSIFAVSSKVEAATPRLMVSDYSVSGGAVVGGKEFDLKIVLKNTAVKTTVKNVKVTLYTENGEILPVEGAGTAFVESVVANGEQELTFKMKAAKGLEEKSYKMTIKTEYESSNGMEYTVEDNIFLPVIMEQRLSVTDLFIEGGDIQIGDSVEVTAKINNLGEGSLYNATATLDGDGVEKQESYIGNIEPGKSGNVDILTTAEEVTNGNSMSYLTITYEDIDGNLKEEKCKLKIDVRRPIYDDLELVKGEQKEKTDWTVVKWAIGVIVVVAIAAVIIIRRAKRKKKILEEF